MSSPSATTSARRGHPARLALLGLYSLDFIIALGRKVGGFCGLLTLGWTYFRLLALGDTTHTLYPGAADPDLRQTLWVALLLIMAQGWDIPTDRIAAFWARLRTHLPTDAAPKMGLPTPPLLRRTVEPVVIRLGRFMDLCVAIANKVGAFAVFVYLIYLAEQIWIAGTPVRDLYPQASDPLVSLLADLCVYLVVLGWWATPFEQIGHFWARLHAPLEPAEPQASLRSPGS